ncbi:MAG: DegT/DnrJ/EryC1/StrS family aminotransferase [Desulfobacteraceae bacterium]|nr:MAG: DegT/DnrJ/EryC1/StrS family aminotransferase [Desulfobacteraceae bacterium]
MIGEREISAVTEVLKGPVLVHGPRSKRFETDFAAWTGSPHAVSLSSCTAGLHLAYFDLGIGPGDEVIVPAQTHNATAHAVALTGAKPVFVDCELETGNIAIDQVEAAITANTRAISVVHFLGMPVAMDRICAMAAKHDLFVLEDCALALGSTYKGRHAGLWGDAGCFSFYPVKHITTAEGGMLITRRRELAERIMRRRAFGVDRTPGERDIPGVYDVTMLGFNYRMNEIAASLGVEQLKRANEFLKLRRRNHELLHAQLSELDEVRLFQSTHGDYVSSYYCLSVLLTQKLRAMRFEIVQKLKDQGVGTSIYYPRPVPHFTWYREKYGCRTDSFPNAAAVSYGSIALPVGPHLNEDDMSFIAAAVKQAISEVNP